MGTRAGEKKGQRRNGGKGRHSLYYVVTFPGEKSTDFCKTGYDHNLGDWVLRSKKGMLVTESHCIL